MLFAYAKYTAFGVNFHIKVVVQVGDFLIGMISYVDESLGLNVVTGESFRIEQDDSQLLDDCIGYYSKIFIEFAPGYGGPFYILLQFNFENKMVWETLEILGARVLFLGEYCTFSLSGVSGFACNCVIYTNDIFQ